jgi:nitrate reductase gamma subunit
MYEFFTGPGLWLSFIIFLGGLALRLSFLIGLSRERDRIIYNHVSFDWGVKSIVHWLFPWASESGRLQPVFSFVCFLFHVSLLAVPLFLCAHNMLWDEAFGVSLWSMPDPVADTLSMAMVASGLFLLARRWIRPEVRILTSSWDVALMLLTLLPFVTGVLAYHQWGPYKPMLLTHIISAELLLVLIPFSKLSHMLLFFFTRSFIGFEMGARRGARSW